MTTEQQPENIVASIVNILSLAPQEGMLAENLLKQLNVPEDVLNCILQALIECGVVEFSDEPDDSDVKV